MNTSVAYPWRRPGFPAPGELFRLGRLLVREPEYAGLWRKHRDTGLLEHAGFFDDQMTREEVSRFLSPDPAHLGWMSPLPSGEDWARVARSGRPLVVLLATGAFAPYHSGHQAMMEAAIGAAQRKGLEVLAAYFSPSHDRYVREKDGGRGASFPATQRIDLLRSRMPSGQEVPWLVDPWEAMGLPGAINFTTVIRRLEAYLNSHRPALAPRVRVVYVFGADNAGFSRVFEPNPSTHPFTICVGRPEHPGSSSGLFVPLNHPESSTRLRRKAMPQACGIERRGSGGGVYLIRNEEEWATSHWSCKVGPEVLARAWQKFGVQVRRAMEQAFTGEEGLPGAQGEPCRPDTFDWIKVSFQRQVVKNWAASRPLVSLDPCVSDIPGVVGWPSSRVFSPSNHQASPLGRALRPGTAKLPHVPRGCHVWLVDDDIATGESMASARKSLEQQGVVVEQCRSLTPPGSLFDVVDLRDFLPGAREAGLVVKAPSGELVRVPYMAPFVNLATRARIPRGQSWVTSLALWESAAYFFESLPVDLLVRDMWPASAQALRLQGVPGNLPLALWCRHWAGVLRAPGLQSGAGRG